MVEHVIYVRTHRDLHPLTHLEAFAHCEIGVEESGSTELVSHLRGKESQVGGRPEICRVEALAEPARAALLGRPQLLYRCGSSSIGDRSCAIGYGVRQTTTGNEVLRQHPSPQ